MGVDSTDTLGIKQTMTKRLDDEKDEVPIKDSIGRN